MDFTLPPIPGIPAWMVTCSGNGEGYSSAYYRCCPSSVLKSPRRSSGYDIAGRDQIPPFINLQRDHEGLIRRGAAWAVNGQYTRSVVEGLYSPVLGLYLFMPLIELTWNGNGYTKCVASHDTRHPA